MGQLIKKRGWEFESELMRGWAGRLKLGLGKQMDCWKNPMWDKSWSKKIPSNQIKGVIGQNKTN